MGDGPIAPQSSGRRAAAYWFSDGLPELAFGSAMTLMGGSGLAWVVWFPNRWLAAIFALASAWFFALYIWNRKIVDAIKARLTYPRTGYAPPPKDGYPEGQYLVTLTAATNPSTKQNVTGFLTNPIYLFILPIPLSSFLRTSWSIAAAMLVIAALAYWGHRWSEDPYSWWSVLILGLTGIPFCFVKLPPRAEAILPILFGGFWLFCRGAWRLTQYLRNNPRRTEASETVI